MSQSLSMVYLHFIFSTKDRFPFLANDDDLQRVHAYLARIFHETHSPALQVGGTKDHIHALCELGRNQSISELMREVKTNSSNFIKTLGGMLSKFGWQGGYGAFSVGVSEVEIVRSYILNQSEHHRVRTFHEEYLEFLRKYNVPYDERYIWT